METKVIVTIKHSKPIDDLLDKVAGRVYTLDGIGGNGDVTASLVWTKKQIDAAIEAKKDVS